MIRARRIRLYPTNEQQTQLYKSAGTARFVYNWTIGKQEDALKHNNRCIKENELRKELTQLKKSELAWLNEVSNNVAKQAVKDACISYQRYFKKLAKRPRMKSKKRTTPSFYNDLIK